MTLTQYMKKSGRDITGFAESIGVSYDALWRWLQADKKKRRYPDRQHARRIVRLSGGLVTLNDLYKGE